MAPKRAVKRKLADATADDPILTDIDTDSETKELQVKLPHGLPLDTQPPSINSAINHPVEQECHRQLREEYIAMSIFPWMSRQLDSDYLRASALSRQGLTTRVFTVGTFYHAGTIGIRANTKKFPWSTALLAYMVRACTHTPFTAVSTLCNVHMRTHRGKYNMEGTLNILIPVTQFRQGQIWIEEEQGPDLSPGGQHRGCKHEVKLPGIEFSPGTCPWKSDRIVLSAYTTQKADEISNKDKIFLRALGFNWQHLSRR